MSKLSSHNNLSGLKLLGNSISRMYCKNTDRINISLGSYDAPPMFDFLYYPAGYVIDSDNKFPDYCSLLTTFRMSRRPQFGGKYFDMLSDNSLIRILETNLRIRFWIKSNTSVSLSFKEKFRFGKITAPCIIYDIPKGYTSNGYPPLSSESRCYVAFFGDVEYLNGTITCTPGRSSIIFSIGTPEKAIKEISAKYSKMILPFVNHTKPFECCAKIMQISNKTNNHAYSCNSSFQKLCSVSQKISGLLNMVQSDAGGILNIDSESCVCSIKDQIIVLYAMLECKKFKAARKLLDFYYRIWSSQKSVGNYTYASRTDSPYDDIYASEGMLMILFGAMNYYDATKDVSYITGISPMLISAMDLLTESCIYGSIPFNQMNQRFSDNIVPAVYSTHGSCINSLIFYIGGRKFLDFAEKKQNAYESIPIQKIDRFKRALNDVVCRFKENFYSIDGYFFANSGKSIVREGKREIYGCCQMCRHNGNKDSYIGWLERTKNGLYVCPRCYSDNIKQLRPRINPESQISSTYIALLCSFYGFPTISQNEYSKSLDNYEMYLRTQVYIRELGLLCCYMKKAGDSSWSDLLKILINRMADDTNEISFIDKCFCFGCICKCLH